MDLKSISWTIIFIVSLIIDILILIFLTINNMDIILFIVIFLALFSAYRLIDMWNMDERTDQALDDAARVTIKIFSFISVMLGSIFILVGYLDFPIFRIIGLTLVIVSLVLIYIHSMLSGYYADRMS